MIRFAVPLLLLATAATGAATEQRVSRADTVKLAKTLSGLKPGKAQNCVRSDRIREVRGFDGEILYVEGRNKLYRNQTHGSCKGLAQGDILVTQTLGSEYCSGDIVQTRAPTGGFFTGSCALGAFVPYTK